MKNEEEIGKRTRTRTYSKFDLKSFSFMRLVVLTGGIACGKTTVAKLFKEQHNIPILDSDEIAHQIQVPGGAAYQPIISYFGEGILNEDKTINRKALGDIIFKDKEKRRTLNKLTHPLVLRTLFLNTFKLWFKREPVVILDIPLFFEIKMPKFLFNDIITVAANSELQLHRLMLRNTLTAEEAKHRIDAQMPVETKCKNSTIVIHNDSDMEDLKKTVDNIVKKWNSSNKFLTLYQDPYVIFLVFFVLIVFLVRKL